MKSEIKKASSKNISDVKPSTRKKNKTVGKVDDFQKPKAKPNPKVRDNSINKRLLDKIINDKLEAFLKDKKKISSFSKLLSDHHKSIRKNRFKILKEYWKKILFLFLSFYTFVAYYSEHMPEYLKAHSLISITVACILYFLWHKRGKIN